MLISGRERVIQAAYQLFTRHGTRTVGIDTVIATAQVAKMTLYRNFASKDELILAVLDRRAQLWTRQWLRAETGRRDSSPAGQLLAIFAIFDEWFTSAEFQGCPFLRTMVEVSDRSDPVRRASVAHLETVRGFARELAEAAGVGDPEAFSRQWQVLMTGSILAAEQGDRHAAEHAREMGVLLLHRHGIATASSDTVGARSSRGGATREQ